MQLKDIGDINLGYPFRGRIKEVLGSGVVAVQMKNVSRADGIDWESCVETKLQGRTKHDWLTQGDILFVARGNNNYAAVVDEPIQGSWAVASPHFYVIRCDHAKVIPHYIAWMLNYGPCQRYFERESEGTLTKSIRRDVLANTEIALPSLAEQKHMVLLMGNILQQQKVLRAQLENNQKLMAGLASEMYQPRQGGFHG